MVFDFGSISLSNAPEDYFHAQEIKSTTPQLVTGKLVYPILSKKIKYDHHLMRS